MFAKRWNVSRDAENICLVYEHRASLKSRASLYVDGSLVAATEWRLNLGPITLHARLPESGASAEATVGYARNGYTRVHRLLVDGRLISGEADVPDLWSEKYPAARGYLQTFVAKGAPVALVYTFLMFVFGIFSIEAPLRGLITGGLLGLTIGSMEWLLAKWVSADRERRKTAGVGSGH